MLDALRRTVSDDSRIAYALVFGSSARGTSHALSDVDIAIGTTADAALGTLDLGALTSRLEAAAGRAVHLVVLNDAPPGLAYRVFKDGTPLLIRDPVAFKSRLARAILEYLAFAWARPMVDKTLLASKIAAIRDAAARVRDVLPADREAFAADRTAREVVLLNLFVAIRACFTFRRAGPAGSGASP